MLILTYFSIHQPATKKKKGGGGVNHPEGRGGGHNKFWGSFKTGA